MNKKIRMLTAYGYKSHFVAKLKVIFHIFLGVRLPTESYDFDCARAYTTLVALAVTARGKNINSALA